MARRFVMIAALVAALGVGIGAFGSHGLRAHFEANPTLEPTFDTASQYHLVHALGLFIAAWVAARWPSRWANAGGWLLLVGLLLFCGSLYILSILNVRIMGAVAPIGGTAFILGWLCLGMAAWKGQE
jgi:uncharacterized membrane protein YgdD (TMEM256/DUF423 family)